MPLRLTYWDIGHLSLTMASAVVAQYFGSLWLLATLALVLTMGIRFYRKQQRIERLEGKLEETRQRLEESGVNRLTEVDDKVAAEDDEGNLIIFP